MWLLCCILPGSVIYSYSPCNYFLSFIYSNNWYNEPKHIVSHHQLMKLLNVCELCAGPTNVVGTVRNGAYTKFTTTCQTCGHSRHWETSEKHRRRPVINIILSAAILFSGCIPSRFLRALGFIAVLIPKLRTYNNHQKTYLHGVSTLSEVN